MRSAGARTVLNCAARAVLRGARSTARLALDTCHRSSIRSTESPEGTIDRFDGVTCVPAPLCLLQWRLFSFLTIPLFIILFMGMLNAITTVGKLIRKKRQGPDGKAGSAKAK